MGLSNTAPYLGVNIYAKNIHFERSVVVFKPNLQNNQTLILLNLWCILIIWRLCGTACVAAVQPPCLCHRRFLPFSSSIVVLSVGLSSSSDSFFCRCIFHIHCAFAYMYCIYLWTLHNFSGLV